MVKRRARRDWELRPLTDEAPPEKSAPQVLPWVHAAGNPYFDWFFGRPETTRNVLSRWLVRSSSEVSLTRATLLLRNGIPIGGLIALSGIELVAARRADTIAIVQDVPAHARPGVLDRLRSSAGMFPAPHAEDYYLSKMGLLPEWQGRGIGRRLVKEFLQQARSKGFRRLYLDVAVDNTQAVRLYNRTGFVVQRVAAPANGPPRYMSMTGDVSRMA